MTSRDDLNFLLSLIPGDKRTASSDQAAARLLVLIEEDEDITRALNWLEKRRETPAVNPGTSKQLYTRSEVNAALNNAANLIQDTHRSENENTVMADDAVNLTVNATGYLLDHPDAGLDEVIPACYTDIELDGYDFTTAELDTCDYASNDSDELVLPEKGSPIWNDALVRKVTGWLA